MGWRLDIAPLAGLKVPDFRVRRDRGDWVWVEVSKPEASDEITGLRKVIEGLAGLVDRIPDGAALELFFLREPEPGDIRLIEEAALALAAQNGTQRIELAATALLFRNEHPPGRMIVDSHGIEDSRPRLGTARARAQVKDGVTQTLAHVSVRMPVSDERAAKLFSREAEQLPPGECGIIVLGLASTPGAESAWAGLIGGQLSRYGHTRVAAGVLFLQATHLAREGSAVASRSDVRVIDNQRAERALPPWLLDRLTRLERASRRATRSAHR